MSSVKEVLLLFARTLWKFPHITAQTRDPIKYVFFSSFKSLLKYLFAKILYILYVLQDRYQVYDVQYTKQYQLNGFKFGCCFLCFVTTCEYFLYPCLTVPNPGMERDGICRSWGQYNFETFDGIYFYFPGNCSYIFARDCSNPVPLYTIWVSKFTFGIKCQKEDTVKFTCLFF